MTAEVMVTMQHARQAKMCSRGQRAFFMRHGLDWLEFLDKGIEASKLEATGDAMAMIVVEIARGRK